MKKAFTLIELLVVVLIIGILAAVALPQYQAAVLKSRYVQIMTVADAICHAEQVYYMANGEYTSDAEALDVQFPAGGGWDSDTHVMSYDNFYFQIASNGIWVQGYLRSSGLSYVNYCNGARRECRSYNQTTSEQAVCLSMGGVKQNCTSCQWDEYILNN